MKHRLLTTSGTKGTYTTANYALASTKPSSGSYIIPRLTRITWTDVYTIPTGASADTFKGYSFETESSLSPIVKLPLLYIPVFCNYLMTDSL